MRKIKNIREVYNRQLFELMEKERKSFQKEDFYDRLAVDNSNDQQPMKDIHRHLYYFYLKHLREEKVLIYETINEKLKQVEIVYGMSGE